MDSVCIFSFAQAMFCCNDDNTLYAFEKCLSRPDSFTNNASSIAKIVTKYNLYDDVDVDVYMGRVGVYRWAMHPLLPHVHQACIGRWRRSGVYALGVVKKSKDVKCK